MTYELFKTDKNKISEIFNYALARGGDYCDVYFEKFNSEYLVLEDHIVAKASVSETIGVGIRVIKGERTGYSFSENLSQKSILDAAKIAAEIADSESSTRSIELSKIDTTNLYKSEGSKRTIPEIINLAKKIDELIFKEDERIIKARVSINSEISQILTASSDGKISTDYRPLNVVSASCTAEHNNRRENNNDSVATRHDMLFFDEKLIKDFIKELVKKTVVLFDAVSPKGGEMELILSGGSSGILLHEAIGHGMEADFIRRKESIFSEKLGKRIANDFITIVDDGTIPYSPGSINIDDENNETQKTVLVENGILNSFMHDRISAKYFKIKPTGNARRESFKYQPLPRMRNTYMLPGPHKKDEIIESVKKGIIAESFSNGQVSIGAGDFTFYVKNGYMITNGKIQAPIKDINIIGNGPDILSKIIMVADDLKMSKGGWYCGKSRQSVPVSMGLPTVKIPSITVGGKN